MKGRIWLGVLVMLLMAAGGAWPDEKRGRCYRFIYDGDELSASEVEEFASEAEERCRSLQRFLGVERTDPVPVYLKAGEGVSSTLPHQNRAIDLYYARPIRGIEAPLVHETTHILVDSPVPVLREGLATAMEERLGGLDTHPTYGYSLEEWMGALHCAGRYVPLKEWETRDWREGPWETNIIAYVESGSFLKSLVDGLGIETVVKAVQWSQKARTTSLDRICELQFGGSLASLEAAWKEETEAAGSTREAGELCRALQEGKIQSHLLHRLERAR
jgi:hypothetical protein